MKNQDLHIMLTEMKGDIKSILEKHELSAKWQTEHEREDRQREKRNEQRFEELNRYAASIAIVSSVITGAGMWIWNKLTQGA